MGYEANAVRGVVNFYGPRLNKGQEFGGKGTTKGNTKEAFWTFDFQNLPASGSEMNLAIPEGSLIKNARLETVTKWLGGTKLELDFVEADGTAIANGEIIDGTDGALANLVVGDIVAEGDAIGDRLGKTGVLEVTATGTFTAGKSRLVVEYVLPAP